MVNVIDIIILPDTSLGYRVQNWRKANPSCIFPPFLINMVNNTSQFSQQTIQTNRTNVHTTENKLLYLCLAFMYV